MHLTTLAALGALGLGLGRWLRDPNLGGLVFLLLLAGLTALAARHLYRPPEPPDPRVDLNSASVEDLQRLPGVGPVAAQRIVDARPFASVEELVRVPGFGPAKVRVLAGEARVSRAASETRKFGPH